MCVSSPVLVCVRLCVYGCVSAHASAVTQILVCFACVDHAFIVYMHLYNHSVYRLCDREQSPWDSAITHSTFGPFNRKPSEICLSADNGSLMLVPCHPLPPHSLSTFRCWQTDRRPLFHSWIRGKQTVAFPFLSSAHASLVHFAACSSWTSSLHFTESLRVFSSLLFFLFGFQRAPFACPLISCSISPLFSFLLLISLSLPPPLPLLFPAVHLSFPLSLSFHLPTVRIHLSGPGVPLATWQVTFFAPPSVGLISNFILSTLSSFFSLHCSLSPVLSLVLPSSVCVITFICPQICLLP